MNILEGYIQERQVETLIVLRHGFFEGNAQAHLTGDAAAEVVAAGRRRDDYDHYPLLPEGRAQAKRARDRFAHVRLGRAALSVDACLCSPPRRTEETAEIFTEDMELPLGFHFAEGLRERDRDIFAYAPDEWARNHPAYPRGGSFLHRRFGNGETEAEVIERALPELIRADKLAAGGTVLLVTHAETMLALRAEQTLGGMDDEQSELPVVPRMSTNIRPLKKSAWVGPAQFDIHTRRNPFTGVLEMRMAYFKTVGETENRRGFDSGWIKNWRTREQ